MRTGTPEAQLAGLSGNPLKSEFCPQRPQPLIPKTSMATARTDFPIFDTPLDLPAYPEDSPWLPGVVFTRVVRGPETPQGQVIFRPQHVPAEESSGTFDLTQLTRNSMGMPRNGELVPLRLAAPFADAVVLAAQGQNALLEQRTAQDNAAYQAGRFDAVTGSHVLGRGLVRLVLETALDLTLPAHRPEWFRKNRVRRELTGYNAAARLGLLYLARPVAAEARDHADKALQRSLDNGVTLLQIELDRRQPFSCAYATAEDRPKRLAHLAHVVLQQANAQLRESSRPASRRLTDEQYAQMLALATPLLEWAATQPRKQERT